ncbi:MAG: peptidyl-prolyl cis-trans isomerase [Lutibacter sp.]
MKKIGYLFLLISVTSCNYFTFKKDNRKPIARVNEHYLYKSDLKNLIKDNISNNDSTTFVKNYINSWAKHQLLLDRAKLNLEENIDSFKELVKKYEEDLYINSYKEKAVNQYLDTTISTSEINQFYNENGKNFKLNEILLQLKYVEIGKSVLNKKEIIKLFRSDKQDDIEILKAKKMAFKSVHLNDSIWVKFNDFITKVPIFKSVNQKVLLKNNAFVQKEDSLSLYLVKISKFLKIGSKPPLSYLKPTIKQIILQKRKLKLLKNIEETLVNDAVKNKQFEIYEH